MFESFGIIDFIDIALASALLLYLYLTMKKSGAINVFLGIVFLLVVFTVLRISRMTLMKGIFDTIISQGVIILIILFQNEIRHFLSDVGSNRSLRFFKRFMHKPSAADKRKWLMPIIYACMSMSKSKTGALIVVQKSTSLSDFVNTGDMIDAKVNNRLLENIFFKNSPLHDYLRWQNPCRRVYSACVARPQLASLLRSSPPFGVGNHPGKRCRGYRGQRGDWQYLMRLQGRNIPQIIKYGTRP